jgi:hypothetical protein
VYGNRVLGLMKAISQRSVEDHDPVLRGQPVSHPYHPISLVRYRIGPRENAGHGSERREILTLGEGFNTQVITLWCFYIVGREILTLGEAVSTLR